MTIHGNLSLGSEVFKPRNLHPSLDFDLILPSSHLSPHHASLQHRRVVFLRAVSSASSRRVRNDPQIIIFPHHHRPPQPHPCIKASLVHTPAPTQHHSSLPAPLTAVQGSTGSDHHRKSSLAERDAHIAHQANNISCRATSRLPSVPPSSLPPSTGRSLPSIYRHLCGDFWQPVADKQDIKSGQQT